MNSCMIVGLMLVVGSYLGTFIVCFMISMFCPWNMQPFKERLIPKIVGMVYVGMILLVAGTVMVIAHVE